MPPFWRRSPEPSASNLDAIVTAAVTKALDTHGAKVTDGRGAMAALNQPNRGLAGYFEAMPWTEPDVAFGPGQRIVPSAIDPLNAQGRTEPRTYEYPISWNLNIGNQRLCPFSILHRASEVDLVRRCIEIRKADIVGLDWDITLSDNAIRQAMDATGERNRAKASVAVRAKFEDQIVALKDFWAKPDRLNNLTFSQWLNALLEEVLVTDALSIYPHPTKGGPLLPGLNSTTHSLRIIDGSTIKPLFDHLGNLPQAPQPAYQQIMYGFPRGEYTYDPKARGELTHDTLMYRPRNRRVRSPYGLPPTEQALAFIDLWLKRQEWLRAEYGVGANPNTWLKPIANNENWSPQQRRQFEKAINDDMSGQTEERHLLHVLPPDLEPVQMTEFAEKYQSTWDDTLALRIASFFDVMGTQLNITPKGGLGGKGHQEGEDAKSEYMARQPTVSYLTDLLNDLNQQYMGAPPELTFVFRSDDEDDIAEVTASRQTELFSGQMTLNDIMAEAGRPLFEFAEADMPFVLAPGAPLTFLEGSSVKPDPPVVVPFGAPAPAPTDPPKPAPKPTDPPTPKDAPTVPAVGSTVEKTAEVAAFKRFSAKPHRREFIWKHHTPDEAKSVEADLKKAPARLPGEEFRSELEQHYAGRIAKVLKDSADGIEETIARVEIHRDKASNPSDLAASQAAQSAVNAGVTIDRAQLLSIVREMYADGYLAGSHVALDQVGSGATLSGTIAGHEDSIDWDNWKPGYADAAVKDADGGLADLLRSADITVRGITDSSMTRLGNALAAGLASGMDVRSIAASLTDILGDSARAGTIAVTETARAMTQASLDTYKNNGVDQWDWLLSEGACEACEDEASENPHDINDDAPPEHPNCRCAIAPIVVIAGQAQEGEAE